MPASSNKCSTTLSLRLRYVRTSFSGSSSWKLNGGSVYTVPWDKRGDPLSITKIMKDEGITYTKATPAEYSLWMQFGPENLKQAHNWRFAFGGGEQLTSFVTQQFAALDLPKLRFFNSYGPAEISISSTKMKSSTVSHRSQHGYHAVINCQTMQCTSSTTSSSLSRWVCTARSILLVPVSHWVT